MDGVATSVILLQLDGMLKTFGWVSNLSNPSAAGWDPVNKYFEIKPFEWGSNLCDPSAVGWDPVNKSFDDKNL